MAPRKKSRMPRPMRLPIVLRAVSSVEEGGVLVLLTGGDCDLGCAVGFGLMSEG